MPCTQDFLNNAKIYISHIDGNCLWLVDFKDKIATTWALSSFVQKDFDTIVAPRKEKYDDFLELLRRETPLVQSFSVPPVPTPSLATFLKIAPTPATLSSGAILQRLSIATPILASLAQADWEMSARSGNPVSHEILVAKALELTDTLLTEVQK